MHANRERKRPVFRRDSARIACIYSADRIIPRQDAPSRTPEGTAKHPQGDSNSCLQDENLIS
jgi:hypothetical protein